MAHFHLFLCRTCCTSSLPCPLGYCWSTLGYIRFCLDECYWLYHDWYCLLSHKFRN
ncbi:unnamed protein product [Brassica napus]|uniref:(rape) hypothetical protein n=1 Tax=Brassica napus TaxID=3708 RepID=A0A817AY65_BRANA|nr:unnamed protein product [Brassica napus]